MTRFPKALRESSLLKTIGSTAAAIAGAMKNPMSAFDEAMAASVSTFEFGKPINNATAVAVRQTEVAGIVGGKGFRLYPPRRVKTVNGQTRAERKAAARERTYVTQVSEIAQINRARDLGLIGMRFVEPTKVADLLRRHDAGDLNLTGIMDVKEVEVAAAARRSTREQLSALTVADLRALAAADQIKVTTKMTKGDLIEAILSKSA